MKVVLIVLDSVGIGAAPDAADYGDTGAATLPHAARAVGGLDLPTLEKLGLGNIPELLPSGIAIDGVRPVDQPLASFGAMREVSQGKDTITGHWELAGLELIPGFHLFPKGPPSFPEEMVADFGKQTGRGILGNKAASGTAIIEELGEEHMKTGSLIAYTSADSVFQIAAHVDVVPLDELYAACDIARKLCDPLRVGRVIARPFRGTRSDNFERTEDRRDFAYETEEPTILQRLHDRGIPVYAVGKIEDIFARRGITKSTHTGNNTSSQEAVVQYTHEMDHGLIFANFIDFDMLYGHRRDAEGYAKSLERVDAFFASYLPSLGEDDVLLITADHGNDPTFKGTDHTREYVPLLVYRKGHEGCNLGVREGFYDVAQSIATFFKTGPLPRGKTFL